MPPQSPGSGGVSYVNEGVERSDLGLARGIITTNIPRTEIKSENAMFDHYMKQLRGDWMRRIEVCQVQTLSLAYYSIRELRAFHSTHQPPMPSLEPPNSLTFVFADN